MAKTTTLVPVSKDVSSAIKAGRHPLTDDWNSPGYLNRDEWDRMGSELERVVEARAEVRVGELRVALNTELEKATSMQEEAKRAVAAKEEEMSNTVALLKGEQARVEQLTQDLSKERIIANELRALENETSEKLGAAYHEIEELKSTLANVRAGLKEIEAGPTGA